MSPVHAMTACCKVEVKLNSFQTSEMHGHERSTSRPGHLKRLQCPSSEKLGGPQRWAGLFGEHKIFHPCWKQLHFLSCLACNLVTTTTALHRLNLARNDLISWPRKFHRRVHNSHNWNILRTSPAGSNSHIFFVSNPF